MSSELDGQFDKDQPTQTTAIESALGNLGGWMLKKNKEAGRSLNIPALNLQLNADGSTQKIDTSKP
jgi:hypothetical protein